MSTKWIARIVGLLMLLAFFIIMANMQRKLVEMQRMQQDATVPVPTST